MPVINKCKTGGHTCNYKPSHLECQLGEAERERHWQAEDAESNLPVWWSSKTPRQVFWQINLKNDQTEHSYIICIPQQASQVLPLVNFIQLGQLLYPA